jgi:Raf kinase inhibitor-like YbhB/YbcL family protein
VLTCIDKNPVANNWVHWMLINIPPTIKEIPEGYKKSDAVNCIICKNSFGYNNYGGPQPPQGTENHKYIFTLYALNAPLKNIKNGEFISEIQLLKLLKDKIISKAEFSLNRSY